TSQKKGDGTPRSTQLPGKRAMEPQDPPSFPEDGEILGRECAARRALGRGCRTELPSPPEQGTPTGGPAPGRAPVGRPYPATSLIRAPRLGRSSVPGAPTPK